MGPREDPSRLITARTAPVRRFSLLGSDPGHRLPKYQAHLVRRALIAGIAVILFFALFDALVTGYPIHATLEGGTALVLTVIAWFHGRGMGSDRAAALGILATGVLILLVVLTGEAADGVIVWLTGFPILPLFLLGRRQGLIIDGLFIILSILALGLLIHHQGEAAGFTWIATFNIAGAMISITALTFLYETMRGTAANDLAQQAKTDPLTGLLNRRGLHDAFPKEAAAARRFARPLSLIVLDLDHFKRVNDTFGHDGGDLALQFVADTMRKLIRQGDWPARVGGEEFAVLLPNTDLEGAKGVGEKIRAGMETTPLVLEGGRRIPLTVSVGLAQAETGPRAGEEDLDSLFVRADRHLYKAKEQGRNRVVWAE